MKRMKNTDMVPTPWAQWTAVAGLMLVVVATAIPLLRINSEWVRWLYSAGALAVLVGRFFNRVPKEAPLRVRRLYRMEVWAGLMFCVGAFFMFYTGSGRMDYMAFTLAGGMIEVYASLMIPRAWRSDG